MHTTRCITAHGGAKQTLQQRDATTFQMSRGQNSVALKGRHDEGIQTADRIQTATACAATAEMMQRGTVYPCLKIGIISNPFLWGLRLKKFLHMLCFLHLRDATTHPSSTPQIFSIPAILLPFLTKLGHPANSIIMLLFQTTLKHKAKQTKVSESWRSNIARDLTLRKWTRVSSSPNPAKLGKFSSSLASCIAAHSIFLCKTYKQLLSPGKAAFGLHLQTH